MKKSNQYSKKLLAALFIALFAGKISASESALADPARFKRELEEVIDTKKNPHLDWEQCVERLCKCIESDKNCKKGSALDSFKETLEQAKKRTDLPKIKKMLEQHTDFLTKEFKAIFPGKWCGFATEAKAAGDKFNAALPYRLKKCMKA